jgi:hypothetical protein
MENPPIITFTTAWYDLGAKFTKEQYYIWAQNLLQNVRKFNLVIYVEDVKMAELIKNISNKNPHIYVIIFPFNELPLYVKYSDEFKNNHIHNIELNNRVSWKLMVLWCSKQFFVENTEECIIKNARNYPHFTTEYYGWMDIGYFRARNGRYVDLTISQIQQFPNIDKIKKLQKDKIHYALVNPQMAQSLNGYVYNRNDNDLPKIPIPMNQISIAGGFFILASGVSKIWRNQFETHLYKYIKGGYVIKDDQYIIIDFILLNPTQFQLWTEPPNNRIDSWFLFQRLLY